MTEPEPLARPTELSSLSEQEGLPNTGRDRPQPPAERRLQTAGGALTSGTVCPDELRLVLRVGLRRPVVGAE
jgi:hypothetical protein